MQIFGQKSMIFLVFGAQKGTLGAGQRQKNKPKRSQKFARTTLFLFIFYKQLIINDFHFIKNASRTTAKFGHVKKKQYLCTGFQNLFWSAKLLKLFNICKLWKRKIVFVCFL